MAQIDLENHFIEICGRRSGGRAVEGKGEKGAVYEETNSIHKKHLKNKSYWNYQGVTSGKGFLRIWDTLWGKNDKRKKNEKGGKRN